MANQEHVARLQEGPEAWNTWRVIHPEVQPDLSGANLSGMTLEGYDFHRADLSQANLSGCSLVGSSFFGADLQRSSLMGANLGRANFHAANLEFASLHETRIDKQTTFSKKWRLVWEIVNEVEPGRHLTQVDLENANLSGAELSGANLAGAAMRGAILRQSRLDGADLTSADLRDTNLQSSSVQGTHFEHALMDNAVLTGVKHWRRILRIAKKGSKNRPVEAAEVATATATATGGRVERFPRPQRHGVA